MFREDIQVSMRERKLRKIHSKTRLWLFDQTKMRCNQAWESSMPGEVSQFYSYVTDHKISNVKRSKIYRDQG